MTIQCIDNVYLADTARVMGEVTLGEGASIWYSANIRGDVAPITVGQRTNVQDGAMIHCDHGFPNVIGSNVTIGHGAIVHGVEVGDGSLIGMGATILGRVKIGKNCLIAAGAVVPPGLEVPDGMVVMGVPGKIVRETTYQEKEYLKTLPERYHGLAQQYATQPDLPTLRPWQGNAS